MKKKLLLFISLVMILSACHTTPQDNNLQMNTSLNNNHASQSLTKSLVDNEIRSINFINDRIGWMALLDRNNQVMIYKTMDSGSSWKNTQLKFNGGGEWIYFLNKDTGYIDGPNHQSLEFTHDGGKNWNDLPLPHTLTDRKSITFHGSTIWYLQGAESHWNHAVLYRSLDYGKNWKKISDINNGCINQGILFVNQQVGWLTGFSPEGICAAYTNDGGKNWSKKPLLNSLQKVGLGQQTTIWPPVFLNARNGWMLAQSVNQLYLLSTANGGSSWNEIYSMNATSEFTPNLKVTNLSDIAFTEQNNLIYTKDGGKSWGEQSIAEQGLVIKQLTMNNSHSGWLLTYNPSLFNPKFTQLYKTKDGVHWVIY